MMQKTTWIWYLGFAVWLADGLVSAHYRNLLHARLAFMIAAVFFAAGLFYSRQK